MLKKTMLGIVALILLVGAENLLAQERRGRPKAEQEQKGPVEQLRRQRAGEEAGRRDVEGMQQRRRQRVVRKAKPERVKALQQKPQQLRPGQVRPMQEGSGRLLDELTKAYRENDREKMGQLIRKMHQLRQRVRQGRAAAAEGGRALRDMPSPAMPPEGRRPRTVEKPRPPTDEDWPRMQPPEDVDVVRPLMPGRGMRGWGQGFQGRGMGGRGQGFRGRGMGRGFQGRGMGRGFQGRGIRGGGRGFQGRGMGMGQGFPGPWCPWLREPVPEVN